MNANTSQFDAMTNRRSRFPVRRAARLALRVAFACLFVGSVLWAVEGVRYLVLRRTRPASTSTQVGMEWPDLSAVFAAEGEWSFSEAGPHFRATIPIADSKVVCEKVSATREILVQLLHHAGDWDQAARELEQGGWQLETRADDDETNLVLATRAREAFWLIGWEKERDERLVLVVPSMAPAPALSNNFE